MEKTLQVGRVQNIDSSIPQELLRLEHYDDEQASAIATVHGSQGSILRVPTIDLHVDNEEKRVDLIANASQEWGLFQVVNHGIPNEVIANLQKVGKQFFELPPEEKQLLAKPLGCDEGYYEKQFHGKTGWVDHLFHKVWPPSLINYQFWPNNPASYREANEEYTKHLRGVVEKILKCMSKGLGLEEDEIKETSGGEELVYLLKINYYSSSSSSCPHHHRPDLALGLLPHTDLSLLTILLPNEVPGLQVSRDDGIWYDVNYIPNALIIHIGDQLEIMSNGKYKAVLHRTIVDKDRTRMSWPVFLEPPSNHRVGPIPKLISIESSPLYKTKNFFDYKYCKLNKLPQ